jgi:two-component system LytT family response regulator
MTTPLRVAVVEDEAPQRRQLVGWLEADTDVALVGEASDGASAVRLIDATRPDLVLLDVSLPEMSGLDVLQRIGHDPEVVFTTAHRDYAIEAFELGAVDYLLKPFGQARLASALERVRERRAERSLERPAEGPRASERVATVGNGDEPLARLFIRDHTGIVPVAVEQIVRMEADGDYTAVHAGGRRYLVGIPLAALHERIRRPDFVRVHRQHVVNLAHVVRFVPYDAVRLRVELVGGGGVVASRAGSQLLRGLAG